MKKQYVVLATIMGMSPIAVSTSQVLADESTSANQISDMIIKSLNERYNDKTQDGLPHVNADPVSDYQNSRYAIFLETTTDLTNEKGLKSIDNHKYYDLIRNRNKENFEKIVEDLKNKKDELVANNAKQEEIDKVTSEYESNLSILNAMKDNTLKHYVFSDVNRVNSIVEKVKSNKLSKVIVIDKGIDNGSAVKKSQFKQLVSLDNQGLSDENELLINAYEAEFGSRTKLIDSIKHMDDGFTVILKSGKTLTFKVGDDAKDLDKPILKDGSILKDSDINDESVYKNIVDFEKIKTEDEKLVSFDVPQGETKIYSFDDVDLTMINIDNIYNKRTGYTREGANFVNMLINAKRKDFRFNYKDTNYALVNKDKTLVSNETEMLNAVHMDKSQIKEVNGRYQTYIDIDVVDVNDKDRVQTLRFKLTANKHNDLVKVLDDIKGYKDVVVGEFEKIYGQNRFETAIKISEKSFKDNEADSVVIVGAHALMDGLSAAPFAASMNSPILLAGDKGLSQNTISEIKRVTKDINKKTVYIVGGEKSVSNETKKQLEDLGAVVVRLSGKDRYDTSLSVAKKIKDNKNAGSSLFVTGGNGAADAMSISATASKVQNGKVSPILIVNKEGLRRDAREYVKDANFTDSYLIGGYNTVSSQVYDELMEINTTERLSGKDRYDTNLVILNKFSRDPKQVALVSGHTDYLVDALTSGPYISKANSEFKLNTPIMLIDNKLHVRQNDFFKGHKDVQITQIGGIVSADAIGEILGILNL